MIIKIYLVLLFFLLECKFRNLNLYMYNEKLKLNQLNCIELNYDLVTFHNNKLTLNLIRFHTS